MKPLLYTFRVLLTGIHLMQSGQLEANLITLNEGFQLPFVPDLLDRKLNGAEQQTLNAAEVGSFEKEFMLLREKLAQAAQKTTLPDAPSAFEALNEILIRIRLASLTT